jgi:hypothetical protein
MGEAANGRVGLSWKTKLSHKHGMSSAHLTRGPDQWARMIGWATIIGLAFGLAGPFGSYPANMFTRLLYWTGLFVVGFLLLWPSLMLALDQGARHGIPLRLSGSVAVIVGCIPLAMIAAGGGYLFWPVRAASMRAAEWYCLTLFVAAPTVTALYWLEVGRFRLGAPTASKPSPMEDGTVGSNEAQPGTSVMASIPEHLATGAICLQMEDHYVRVHQPDRSTLHLSRMRDAIEAAGTARGVQVHRSWWVADDGVVAWSQQDRAIVLILSNGLQVPVSRSRLVEVRQRGWLDATRRLSAPENA